MYFGLSEEQRELANILHTLLERRSDPLAVRAAMTHQLGYDPDLWQTLSEEIGAPALAIPEEFGGAGFTSFETHIVLEELGYSLAPSPLLASAVLGARALLLSHSDEAKERLLPGIAEGSAIATVAWADAGARWRTDGSDIHATQASGWHLSGEATLVLDGLTADTILAVASTGDSVGLFEVTDAEQVRRIATPAVDPAMSFATLAFDNVAATVIEPDATSVLDSLRDVATIAIAAIQVGVAQRGLDMTVRYSKERVQFGRPIGSFQALKHRMADMQVAVETARTVAWSAAWAAATGDPELGRHAALAKAWCSDALDLVASETIQLHGGIAITWEHDAHLVFKRAHALRLLLGSPEAARQHLWAGTVSAL